MEKTQNKALKILGLLFVLATIFYVFYASCSLRVLYLDGSYYMTVFLNKVADNNFSLTHITEHPRKMVNYLLQAPILFTGFCFRDITNKIVFNTIYSFSWFLLPVLGLWWNYELTKRTKQYTVLFLSVFSYITMVLLYQIFSVVESCIGIPLQFVLLNYLLGKINYTKWDKIGIFTILVLMFETYEYTLFLGVIIFAIMLTCLYDEENPHSLLMKIIIGAGSLAASTYNLFFILLSREEQGEFIRFLKEAINFFPLWNRLNLLVVLVTLALIVGCILLRRNQTLPKTIITIFCGIYVYLFFHMLHNPQVFINPIYEQHIRTAPNWAIPLIFGCIFLARLKKIPENTALIKNLYVPVLLCGMTLTAWQIVTTFYWNENISYFKEEVDKCESPLYFPSENPQKEISSFFNKENRRFIWDANLFTTALMVTPETKINTIVTHYEQPRDENNPTLREMQFVLPNEGILGVPYNDVIYIKNKFWDLTEPAQALDEYNEKNLIETLKNEKGEKVALLLAQRGKVDKKLTSKEKANEEEE